MVVGPPYQGERKQVKLTPIKKARHYQGVVEQVRRSIEYGELKAGDRLPSERDLASALGISRGAVREAISSLETARIVEIRPGVGVFLRDDGAKEIVSRIDSILNSRDAHLIEMLELRQGVETQAAYLAALRADERLVNGVEEAYRDLERAVEGGRVGAEEDFRFHLAVVEASRSPMLGEVIELVSGRFKDGLEESRKESLSIPGQSQAILLEHREILEAIRAGEAQRARDRMWSHLENVRARYL
jgi:GntR family transcriptional repressor for pyruvate dehydrogenase complex